MRFLATILLCLLASSCFGQNINSPTVWTKAMSPVTVRTLNIYSSLTIEAGVEVRLFDSSFIRLWRGSDSKLIVNGTAEQPVVFKASGLAPWSGITAVLTATRPVIRANNVVFQDFGAFNNVLDLRNTDFQFIDCKFISPATVQSGYSQAGQAISLCRTWGTATPIGSFEGCEASGFTNGVLLAPGMALIDCDFFNIASPILSRVPGRAIGVSVLGL